MTWSAAFADAKSRCYKGHPGYLAIVGSQEENDYLHTLIQEKGSYQVWQKAWRQKKNLGKKRLAEKGEPSRAACGAGASGAANRPPNWWSEHRSGRFLPPLARTAARAKSWEPPLTAPLPPLLRFSWPRRFFFL